MNCDEIRKLSPLWHSGELGDHQRRAFDFHLGTCTSCGELIRDEEFADRRLRVAAAEDMALQAAAAKELQRRVLQTIAKERYSRWLVASSGVAAALLAAVWLVNVHRNAQNVPANPAIFADAARDHTAEVTEEAPRHWRTEPAEILELEKSQGVSDEAVKAVEATGYKLEKAKICRLGGVPYMHLVYEKGGRDFSVSMRVKGGQPMPQAVSTNGALQLSSFTRGNVQAVIVSDASRNDCDKFTADAERAL
jgi:anti-sigma factor RsiW